MHIDIEFCPPDNRARDLDNMLAASKALLDGVADATGIDDSLWSLSIRRGEKRKGGAVIVVISSDSGWQHVGDVAARIAEGVSNEKPGCVGSHRAATASMKGNGDD